MTDSENSQPQDDSDEDIYKDIPEFNFEDELAKLEGSKETYKQEASDLSEKVKLLTEENKELKKSNEILKKNLSTLLKTAQAEVQRKDTMIQDLRTQVESFTFRRNKTTTKDKYTSTFDLELNMKVKCEAEKLKSDVKSSKSHENRTATDFELKPNQEEEKWKESLNSKDENINCDNDRNSGYRKSSKTNFRHSENSHERYREKKSNRYEDSSEYRRSYRKDHRSHSKSDSFDKSRHSRSSDSRFLSRRRHSRERRSDHRKHDNSEGKRSEESSERSRRRRGRSRSREISRESKEPSLEKPKLRSSLDKDLIVRSKEPVHVKSEVTNGVKGSDAVADSKKSRVEIPEKATVQEDGGKNKAVKEKRPNKQEKRSSLDIFNTKSPLEALYNEMVTSRNSNRFSNPKGEAQAESDFEEGEIPVTQTGNERLETSESQPEEDWTLSFKNERQNETRPMTLYSRRMMRKFSSESKPTQNPTGKEQTEKPRVEQEKVEKSQEVEKEPGELTDDENIVESSKEFQELTKVASIEIELNEKPATEMFKEPVGTVSPELETVTAEPSPKENQKEVEKPNCGKEEANVCKEAEPDRETREVIEFSPFKNNYKLIEISPIKPSGTEHILDFYNQRARPTQAAEQASLDSSEVMTESEKSKLSDTSEEKNSEAELKIVIPPTCGSPKEKEKSDEKEVKESKKKKDDKKSNETKKEDNLGRGKRKAASKKETDKPQIPDEKNQKRKRKASETEEGFSDAKKRKVEKNEPSRKSSRNKSNSISESEKGKSEPPQPEREKKTKEDISSFEFFKPAAKAEIPQTPVDPNKFVSTTTDYKMTATMSVTGVVRLETPDKCMEKLKNLMINEHMIFNVLDSKNNSQFSPLIGSKCIEMTPRRMLKNDLMLTDSEDDSVVKQNAEKGEEEDEVEEEEEEVGEEEEESGSGQSECDSDSGASDFVDML